jgi:hypothetical protein
VGAGQRVSERRTPRLDIRLPRIPNPAPEIFVWSRAAIWIAALLALYWFEPNRHPQADRWDTARLHELGAAPLLFAAFPLVLWIQLGDPWAFLDAQERWNLELSPAGPLGGVWEGVRAVFQGDTPVGADPMHARAVNAQGLVALVLFAVLTVVAWRRFGAPYGLFATLSLALPLSVPSDRWPLLSLPRFGLVVFPFFLALAALGGRPRVHAAILSCSALLLGVAVTQWALWQWVS